MTVTGGVAIRADHVEDESNDDKETFGLVSLPVEVQGTAATTRLDPKRRTTGHQHEPFVDVIGMACCSTDAGDYAHTSRYRRAAGRARRTDGGRRAGRRIARRTCRPTCDTMPAAAARCAASATSSPASSPTTTSRSAADRCSSSGEGRCGSAELIGVGGVRRRRHRTARTCQIFRGVAHWRRPRPSLFQPDRADPPGCRLPAQSA